MENCSSAISNKMKKHKKINNYFIYFSKIKCLISSRRECIESIIITLNKLSRFNTINLSKEIIFISLVAFPVLVDASARTTSGSSVVIRNHREIVSGSARRRKSWRTNISSVSTHIINYNNI